MLNYVVLEVAEVTNDSGAVAVATSRDESGPVTGLVEYIKIDLGGASTPDIDVDITTQGGKSLTLFSADDMSADDCFPVREQAQDYASAALTTEYGKFPLIGDRIRLDAYDANKTGISCRAYIYFSN